MLSINTFLWVYLQKYFYSSLSLILFLGFIASINQIFPYLTFPKDLFLFITQCNSCKKIILPFTAKRIEVITHYIASTTFIIKQRKIV